METPRGFRVWGLDFRGNGEENGNDYYGLYRDYYEDPFLNPKPSNL